jgi:hypothetical protein
MSRKSVYFTRLAVSVICAAISISSAVAQSASPAVADQLRAYKIVKLAEDSNGLAVVQPGTVLTLLQGGLLAVPPANVVNCSAKFQNGQMKAAGGFCAAMVKDVSRYFQSGEKVYPLKIDVNVKKEEISFKVVACDACNGVDPSFYKSEVVFQFPKGFLETAQPGAVQQTIAQVFSTDEGSPQQAQGQQPAVDAPPAQAAQAPPPPIAAPPAIAAPPPPTDQPPVTIAVGQNVDQVTAALGQPQRIANVGAKQIYFFKDLKVTFTNGKVSDVE